MADFLEENAPGGRLASHHNGSVSDVFRHITSFYFGRSNCFLVLLKLFVFLRPFSWLDSDFS